MKVTVEVKGNTYGGTTAPLDVGGFTFSWLDASTIVAESASLAEADLTSVFPQLQPRLMYLLLAPIQLYVSIPGRVDVILSDQRFFHGPNGAPRSAADIPRIRDVMVEHMLARGDRSRAATLRANAPLLYAVEHLILAVLTPQSPLPELYKVVEVLQGTFGGRRSFSSLGLTKDYVDFIMRRANYKTFDERHAPANPNDISAVPLDELRECLVRAREIVSKYAGSL